MPGKELSGTEFGKLVRVYREQRGWTHEQLANRWQRTRDYVLQAERGRLKLDGEEQANRLAAILDIPLPRLDILKKALPEQPIVAQHPSESDDVLFQLLLEPAYVTMKLSWLLWHGAGNAINIDNLSDLAGELDQALSQYRGTLRKLSLQMLAYVYEMMARNAFDKLKYKGANKHLVEMYELGDELNDATIKAEALILQGDILRQRGRHELALRTLETAGPYVDLAHYWIKKAYWQTLAHTYAACGAAERFAEAIEKAQQATGETRESVDIQAAQWYFVEVLQEKAYGYTLLWQTTKALEIYQEIDHMKPFLPLRDLGLYTINKAQAYAYNGEFNEGIRLALDGLKLAREYRSRSQIERLQRLYDRLSVTPAGKQAIVRELRDGLLTVKLELGWE